MILVAGPMVFMDAADGPQHRFHSVVVITFASHAKGPRFETGWKQTFFLSVTFTFPFKKAKRAKGRG